VTHSPEQVADVAIIGAGLMGSAAALFLRRRGRSVLLLERGLAGQQASGVNFGNVRRQGRPLRQLPLANRASAWWRRMPELVGMDVEYLQYGHMRVCYRDRPERVAEFEHYARAARPLGLELEILGAPALRERFPFLGPEVLAASYCAEDGHANPRLVAPALARAAGRLGAQVFEKTAVAHLEKSGEDFRISSDDGRVFRAPIVLITAGVWAQALSAQLGEPVPLIGRGPTMCVTEPVPYCIRPSVGASTPIERESVYFRQIPRGNVIIGGSTRGPVVPDLWRAWVQPRNTLSQLRQIQRLAPALARLHVIRVWTGIEGYTPDDQPVMGPSERVGGLYYAFGFSGAGFQLGPGVGDVMAELIDTGATDVPLDDYRVGRFAGLGSAQPAVAATVSR
jgi:sarcosine oxidase subunit beta